MNCWFSGVYDRGARVPRERGQDSQGSSSMSSGDNLVLYAAVYSDDGTAASDFAALKSADEASDESDFITEVQRGVWIN